LPSASSAKAAENGTTLAAMMMERIFCIRPDVHLPNTTGVFQHEAINGAEIAEACFDSNPP
ncbi:MAG: hypothetical protein KDJ74_16510, partial [Notoacmeibacter sp.]|nr:hypothetical protein [Notoacmeibacter sp.]